MTPTRLAKGVFAGGGIWGSAGSRASLPYEKATVLKLAVVALVVLGLAVVTTMSGRGGGNFYVLTALTATVLVIVSAPVVE